MAGMNTVPFSGSELLLLLVVHCSSARFFRGGGWHGRDAGRHQDKPPTLQDGVPADMALVPVSTSRTVHSVSGTEMRPYACAQPGPSLPSDLAARGCGTGGCASVALGYCLLEGDVGGLVSREQHLLVCLGTQGLGEDMGICAAGCQGGFTSRGAQLSTSL